MDYALYNFLHPFFSFLLSLIVLLYCLKPNEFSQKLDNLKFAIQSETDQEQSDRYRYILHANKNDDICGMESNAATTDAVTEEQCTEYRTLNNYVGGTINDNSYPKGCSVYINTAGTSIPEVNYNTWNEDLLEDARTDIGTVDVNGFVSHLVCYGNPNRYNPKGCFLDTKNNLHYNGDTVFSDCSTDKQCLCSFAVPVFDVNGGLKEASNEELCSSLCSDDPSCHYLQLQDGVCYGLDTFDTTNTYGWSLQHDWTYCPTTHGSGMTVSRC